MPPCNVVLPMVYLPLALENCTPVPAAASITLPEVVPEVVGLKVIVPPVWLATDTAA